MPAQRELLVRRGEVALAGSVWLPTGEPIATVLIHPGSGPSDLDNDVLFPPIREHLLGCGDRSRVVRQARGGRLDGTLAGRRDRGSGGRRARLPRGSAYRCAGAGRPLRAQPGGWVVLEAAAGSPDVAFVATNSGPGVTPDAQERFAARTYMAKAGIPEEEIDAVDHYYGMIVSLMRSGASLSETRARVAESGAPLAFETLSLPILPEDEASGGCSPR